MWRTADAPGSTGAVAGAAVGGAVVAVRDAGVPRYARIRSAGTWTLAIAGLAAYNWWLLVPLRPGLMTSPDELFSNLEVTGQPYAVLMQHADLASGLLLLAAFLIAGPGALVGASHEWLSMLGFAVAGAMGGLYPEVCADSVSAGCRRLEYRFQLPAAQYIHMAAGLAEFAAITIALLFATGRTRLASTRPARIYRGTAKAALLAYPLLGAAYLSDHLGAIMEAVFFTGFSVFVLTQIAERASALRARRQRRPLPVPALRCAVQTIRRQVPAGATSITGDRPAAVIHTEALTKIYSGADFAAVDKLNLDVVAGEIFGLLGPNGAGKTTTAGMLTTRVVPTSGRAFIGGIDVARHPALAKQLSGIVSQQNTLDRQLTVWENLYFHGRLFGIGARESRRTADRLLEEFQLSRWGKASVYALSGGMAQRLMVARAIFHRPSVLFLDEPTAGLDPQSRLALWDLLGELHRSGQTILLTTHYMEEADKLCDRVAIMDHGRILALDTPAALKQSVGADTVVTVKTSGDPGQLAVLLTRDLDGVTRTRPLPHGLELHVKGTDRLVPQIVLAAEGGGFDVVDLSVAEPSLETVFINLTGKELREE